MSGPMIIIFKNPTDDMWEARYVVGGGAPPRIIRGWAIVFQLLGQVHRMITQSLIDRKNDGR